jgi:outer membrane protein assembly factor BamB
VTNVHESRIRAASSAVAAAVLGLGLITAAGCGDSGRVEHRFVADSDQPISIADVPESKFRTLKQTSFERSWDLQLGSKALTSWISANVPNLVFFQVAADNSVVAVDTMSGATRWTSMPLPKPIKLAPYVARVAMKNQGGEAYNDDRLYLISDDIVFCFDLASGQLVWRYNLPFSPSTGPLAHGAEGDLRLYVGDWEGRVRVTTLHPEKHFPYEAWQWNLGVDLSADPYEREDLVYVGDHSGKLRCFGLDRELKWTYNAGGPIYGSPAARDQVLYFGNHDNVLYALNRLTGEKLGQFNLNGPIMRQPMLYRGEPKRVYTWVSMDEGQVSGLYAIRAVPDTVSFADNTPDHPHPSISVVRMGQDWHFPGVTRIVCSTPQHLFLSYPNSTVVLAVRRDNGELEWAWDAAEERGGGKKAARVNLITEYSDPTDLDRTIFTADDHGEVIAYRWFGYVPDSDSTAPVARGAAVTAPKGKKKDAAPADEAKSGRAIAGSDGPRGVSRAVGRFRARAAGRLRPRPHTWWTLIVFAPTALTPQITTTVSPSWNTPWRMHSSTPASSWSLMSSR